MRFMRFVQIMQQMSCLSKVLKLDGGKYTCGGNYGSLLFLLLFLLFL